MFEPQKNIDWRRSRKAEEIRSTAPWLIWKEWPEPALTWMSLLPVLGKLQNPKGAALWKWLDTACLTSVLETGYVIQLDLSFLHAVTPQHLSDFPESTVMEKEIASTAYRL